MGQPEVADGAERYNIRRKAIGAFALPAVGNKLAKTMKPRKKEKVTFKELHIRLRQL